MRQQDHASIINITNFDNLHSHSGGFAVYQYRLLTLICAANAFNAITIMAPIFLSNAVVEYWHLPKISGSALSSIFFIGFCAGLLFVAPLSDKHGRRPIINLCSYATTAFYMLSFLATSYKFLLLCRLCCGFFAGSVMTTLSVLALEFSSSDRRAFCKASLSVAFSLGTVYFVIAAYVLRNVSWRYLAFAHLPMIPILVLLYYKLPESPRFLYSHHKHEELYYQMQLVAKTNKSSFLDYDQFFLTTLIQDVTHCDTGSEKSSIGPLFAPSLRKIAIILPFTQFTCNFIYFAISLLDHPSSDNIYITALLGALVEIPAVLTISPITNVLGRNKCYALFFSIASFFLLALSMISHKRIHWVSCFILIIRLSGAILTTLIYVILAESFPTSIRNLALSWGNLFGKLAAIFAQPFINHVPYALKILAILGIGAALSLKWVPETNKDMKD